MGGDWIQKQDQTQEQVQQMIKIPVQNTFDNSWGVKEQSVYTDVNLQTDSFIQVVSDIHWGWLLAGGVCFVIGALALIILGLKLTPLGGIIAKAWNGLKAMFKALIAWKPKGGK